jgi:hypothetical protein
MKRKHNSLHLAYSNDDICFYSYRCNNFFNADWNKGYMTRTCFIMPNRNKSRLFVGTGVRSIILRSSRTGHKTDSIIVEQDIFLSPY